MNSYVAPRISSFFVAILRNSWLLRAICASNLNIFNHHLLRSRLNQRFPKCGAGLGDVSTTTIEIILPTGIWNAYAGRSQWLSAAMASAGAMRQAGNCGMVPLVVVIQLDQDDAATMRTGRRDAVPERHQGHSSKHLFLQSNTYGRGHHPLAVVDGKRLRPRRAVSATVHANGKTGYANLGEAMWGVKYKFMT